MKKLVSMILVGASVLSLCACGGGSSTPATTQAPADTTAAPADSKAEETTAAAAEEPAASGESYTFRCSTNHAESFCTSVGLAKFADLVKERTNGRINIEVYYDAVLGDEKSAIEQVQYGGLEFARVNISPLAEFVDGFNALMMPYIYTSNEHFWKVHEGEIGMGMLKGEDMTKAGMYGLTYYDGGTRCFYNSKKEVHTPADMKGLTIRVQESSLMMGMIEALGASPQPMPFGDVYSGLQTGVIDGAENSIAQYLEMSHYEVAPYLSLDNHVRAADCLIMSEKTRQMLSAEDLEIIEAAALESWDYQRELWAEAETAALEQLKDSGVTVTELTAEEYQQFVDACASMVSSYEGGKYQPILDQIAALAD